MAAGVRPEGHALAEQHGHHVEPQLVDEVAAEEGARDLAAADQPDGALRARREVVDQGAQVAAVVREHPGGGVVRSGRPVTTAVGLPSYGQPQPRTWSYVRRPMTSEPTPARNSS